MSNQVLRRTAKGKTVMKSFRMDKELYEFLTEVAEVKSVSNLLNELVRRYKQDIENMDRLILKKEGEG